ncbi:MAG: dihydropteroate synthase [Gammaproteobacteria bacterium]
MQLQLGTEHLDLTQPRVMGVLNRTPDSFSDGGAFLDLDTALRHALAMRRAGAAIIDIGGESTRPGAQAVSAAEELDRVIPLIERLVAEAEVPISIDTSKPAVMRAAVAAGARMINDVYALRQPGALEAARTCGVPVCLMHMQGEPRDMQHHPQYRDVVAEVRQFLEERVAVCAAAGIDRGRLLVDPGFGFGKTLEHNLALLRGLGALTELGLPVVAGLSRKSSIGKLLGGAPADQRLYGSLAAAVVAVLNGAALIRTHDVQPTVDALKVAAAVCTRQC